MTRPHRTGFALPEQGAPIDAIAIPRLLSYQGRFLDAAGNPVIDTTYPATFSLYTVPVGGTAFWAEAQPVRTRGGLFSVLLGSTVPIGTLPEAGDLYLGTRIESEPEMTPRLRIVSAAYAYLAERARHADTADFAWTGVISESLAGSLAVCQDLRVYGRGRFGDSCLGSGVAAFCAGQANRALGNYSTVGGGQRCKADSDYAAVAGGDRNWAFGRYAAISGGVGNTARAGSFVGGGRDNLAGGENYSVIGGGELNHVGASHGVITGGFDNRIDGPFSTIGGGSGNFIDSAYATVGGGGGSYASGRGAVIGGGWVNRCLGSHAVIAGGDSNTITGRAGTVAGGTGNTVEAVFGGVLSGVGNSAGDDVSDSAAVVCGGIDNEATDRRSFVGGGSFNRADGQGAFVGGGEYDTAGHNYATVAGGLHNRASGEFSFVGGGSGNTAATDATVSGGAYNTASGTYATVGGGLMNTASGYLATVSGGRLNAARGQTSKAEGCFARANHAGSFVWGDSADSAGDSVYTTAASQWRVRARGGTWFFSNAGMTAGAYLAAGSNSWVSACDSGTKEDFRDVDRQELLEKVAALRVRNYKMKDQDDGTRHVGPVAQDFHAAFGVGETSTGINMADADGVLLAAVQALYEQNQRQQAEIEQLKAELRARR